MSFTDVKIKIPGPGDVNDAMYWKRAWGIWGILKKSVESCSPKKKGDFRELAVALWRAPHVLVGGGGQMKKPA